LNQPVGKTIPLLLESNMGDQRREPSKPEPKPAKETPESHELSPEELRAISGGNTTPNPIIVSNFPKYHPPKG